MASPVRRPSGVCRRVRNSKRSATAVDLAPSASGPHADLPCPQKWSAAVFWSPTLPLQLVWPLVFTSVSWYAVSMFALYCARRPGAEPLLFLLLAAIQAVQATFSWMHWMRARTGWLCALDKIFARLSFALYTLVALGLIRDVWLCALGWPLWAVMVTCYRASLRYWESDGLTRGRWVAAHAGFHTCVGVGQCMILHGASAT